MEASPLEIRRTGKEGLAITWSDGTDSFISSQILRDHCPCAECGVKRGDDSHAAPLTPKKKSLMVIQHTKEESLSLESVWGVGQYAIGMQWGDGHNSGIYTFPLLRQLSKR